MSQVPKIILQLENLQRFVESIKTLFHYDDIGLFSPELKKENGYRYYSYHQLSIFGIISSLKEIKMPLKEIKTYIDKRTPNLLIELLEKKTIDIKNEIEN